MVEKQKKDVVIDASEQVLGRVCSVAAKRLLNGEKVTIVNAEKAVITGKPEMVYRIYREKRERGDPHHGPYYPTLPEAIMRRSIRGMLPRKQERGRSAIRNLRVYADNPQNTTGERTGKNTSQLVHKYVTLDQISKHLRGGK